MLTAAELRFIEPENPLDELTTNQRVVIEAILREAQQKWRPISTAPRDGSDFLARISYATKHHQMVGCFAADRKFHAWPG